MCWSVVAVRVEDCEPSWDILSDPSVLEFNNAGTLANFLRNCVPFTNVQR